MNVFILLVTLLHFVRVGSVAYPASVCPLCFEHYSLLSLKNLAWNSSTLPIVLRPKSLIAKGLLATNCSDLFIRYRSVDSGDPSHDTVVESTKWLNTWFEGSCNPDAPSLVVWANVSNLTRIDPSAHDFLEVFSHCVLDDGAGGSRDATALELANATSLGIIGGEQLDWDDAMFYGLTKSSTVGCRGSWDVVAGQDDRFVWMDGSRSGVATVTESSSHSHSLVDPTTGTSPYNVTELSDWAMTAKVDLSGACASYACWSDHPHLLDAADVAITYEATEPPFVKLMLCESKALVVDVLGAGTADVVMLSVADSTPGFVPALTEMGHLVRLTDTLAEIGTTDGSMTHHHDVSGVTEGGDRCDIESIDEDSGSGSTRVAASGSGVANGACGSAAPHTHSFPNTDSAQGSNLPTYTNMSLVVKDFASGLSDATVLLDSYKYLRLLASGIPPMGWTRDLDSRFSGTFLRAGSPSVKVAAASHDHPTRTGFVLDPTLASAAWWTNPASPYVLADRDHTHKFDIRLSDTSANDKLPRIEFMILKRVNVDVKTETAPVTCYGILWNDSWVCSGQRGTCQQLNTCVCKPGYKGKQCGVSLCFGSYEPTSCAHGNCTDINWCECRAQWTKNTTNTTCVTPLCHGIPAYNTSTVCSGHGNCLLNHSCACEARYGGDQCQDVLCYGRPASSSLVCSGEGLCVDYNTCVCSNHTRYTGQWCGTPVCRGIPGNSSDVCSGHGTCNGFDSCACSTNASGYAGVWCSTPVCRGIEHKNGTCECVIPGWTGSLCHQRDIICEDGNWNGSSSVCSSHGWCLKTNGLCICAPGWEGALCATADVKCEDGGWNASRACTGHGHCSREGGKCFCSHPRWSGDKCDKWVLKCLNGRLSSNPNACWGHGTCQTEGGKCMCNSGWGGGDCANRVLTGGETAGLVLGSLAGVIVAVVIVIALVVAFILFRPRLARCVQNAKEKRLSQRQLSIRMQAFRVEEEEVDIAHLKIDSSLFEIDFADLSIVRRIGSGGGSAVVFLANWSGGQHVAFKCFRISDFLAQDRFDAFEKEARIMGSISHPSLLRFFGCCLSNPRVGIVMEYCSNGDLSAYLVAHPDTPLYRRIHWMMEVAGALEYLHARNIIHRDLKCENVLLDDSLRARVMDFGISRVNITLSMTSHIGTPVYMAPELVMGSRYSDKVDVFSWAIMAFVLAHSGCTNPYLLGRDDQQDEDQFMCRIEFRVANDPHCRPIFKHEEEGQEAIPQRLRELVKSCWAHSPADRPEASTVTSTLQDIILQERFDVEVN